MPSIAYVNKIRWEHAQVLVEEVDATFIDTLGNGLSDLMRSAALNHVERCPAVLGLCAGGGADEERVLQLALQVVLLDMVGEHGWDHPMGLIISILRQLPFFFRGESMRGELEAIEA